MKLTIRKIFAACLLLCLVMQGHAQTFEGIVKWSFASEITDPKVKAQMEQAQKQMSDPANQAKMKELEAKMNDPQFKAMMESNPQMKTQMEAMLKSMNGGDLTSLMPKGTTIKVKNGNTLMSMEGGIMADQEILYLKDKGESYTINRKDKTYWMLPKQTNDPADANTKLQNEAKVTKTSETAKILGYTCTKYLVETKSKDVIMTQSFWTTTDIKDFDTKSLANQRLGNSTQSLFYDKIDGVPLRIQMKMPQGNMTMEATEIKRQSLSSADFVVPAGFKEVSTPGFGRTH